MKRLKNVEGKNEEQLKAIKDQKEEQLKVIKDQGKKQLKLHESDANSANTKTFQRWKCLNRLNTGAIEWFHRIKRIYKEIDYTKLVCVHSNRRIFNFNHFRKLGDFIRSIYFGEISLRHATERQN